MRPELETRIRKNSATMEKNMDNGSEVEASFELATFIIDLVIYLA